MTSLDFELEATVDAIRAAGASRVALQFPDALLPHATSVLDALHAALPAVRAFVLADTSYGSCCVDEVAAQHVSADLIVHYGATCLSPTTRLPVHYVLGRAAFDADAAMRALLDEAPQGVPLVVLFDLALAWAMPAFRARLQTVPSLPVVVASVCRASRVRVTSPGPTTGPDSGTCACASSLSASVASPAAPSPSSSSCPCACGEDETVSVAGQCFPVPTVAVQDGETPEQRRQRALASVHFVYFGDEGPALTTILMNYAFVPVC